jgi:hypothetical protein
MIIKNMQWLNVVDVINVCLYSMAALRSWERYKNTKGGDRPTELRKDFLLAIAWVCIGSFCSSSEDHLEAVLPDRTGQPRNSIRAILRIVLFDAMVIQVSDRVVDGHVLCELLV